MTDHTEMKRLAEAFPEFDWDSNTEPFFNGPSGESLGGGSTGFYCVYGPEFEIDGESYDGVTLVESCPADQAKFICEAKAGILGLIAENEACASRLHEVATACATAEQERDQLKAENEALREEVALDDKLIADRDRLLNMFECPDHGQCIPYAMEQVEALRKDAEQWRALVGRSKSPVIGFTGCVICGVYTDHGGLPCPKTRATADAAMAKGQQS